MADKNIIKELRLKNVDKPRHYFVGDLEQNKLVSLYKSKLY